MPKDIPEDAAKAEGEMQTVQEIAAKLAADPNAQLPPLSIDPNLGRKVRTYVRVERRVDASRQSHVYLFPNGPCVRQATRGCWNDSISGYSTAPL